MAGSPSPVIFLNKDTCARTLHVFQVSFLPLVFTDRFWRVQVTRAALAPLIAAMPQLADQIAEVITTRRCFTCMRVFLCSNVRLVPLPCCGFRTIFILPNVEPVEGMLLLLNCDTCGLEEMYCTCHIFRAIRQIVMTPTYGKWRFNDEFFHKVCFLADFWISGFSSEHSLRQLCLNVFSLGPSSPRRNTRLKIAFGFKPG